MMRDILPSCFPLSTCEPHEKAELWRGPIRALEDCKSVRAFTAWPDSRRHREDSPSGNAHICARKTDGVIACWGDNYGGQLGFGEVPYVLSPTVSSGNLSGLKALTAGLAHACAITSSNTVACWGHNENGQLGLGHTSPVDAPTEIPSENLAGVTALSSGAFHTCALKDNGTVACWGDNYWGQLGLGHRTGASAPALIPGTTLSGVAAVTAAGETHTCALKNDGSVACWGNNYYGQLGLGHTFSVITPAAIPTALLSDATAIVEKVFHTCALKRGGVVACWGKNDLAALGIPSPQSYRTSPVDILGERIFKDGLE
jgi:alpha-tubulin suppressor-like RCC1 family protein